MEALKNKLLTYIDDERLKVNESMARHTTFRCGGNAALYVEPENLAQLLSALDVCRAEKVPFIIMGNGSNLLFTDKGYEGVVIRIGKGTDQVRVVGNYIYAEAGALLSKIAFDAADNKLSGLEFACGIPGSLGGAVFMNAGAYGGEMKDVLASVCSVNRYGIMKDRKAEDCGFGYRHSIFMDNDETIVAAKFYLPSGADDQIEARMVDFSCRRQEKQPINYPSAGSFFKRPEGYFAGGLIEQAGLKGFAVGGAQVSELHAGFIINTGGATATDVLDLMDHVRETVYKMSGVMLEPEVRIIGER